MSKDEALNLALQALENTTPTGFNMERDKQFFASITAIKEALAQPEPWEKFCDSNCVWTDHHPDCKLAEQKPVACDGDFPEGFDASLGVPAQALRVANAIMCDVIGKREWDVPCTAQHVLSFAQKYTTPPQRKPLTDEEIRRANHHMVEGAYDYSFKQGVKWAEYKHGIKGEA